MVLFIVKPPAKHSNLILVFLNKNDEIFFHVFKNGTKTFLDFYCVLLLTFNSLSLPDSMTAGWMDSWIDV